MASYKGFDMLTLKMYAAQKNIFEVNFRYKYIYINVFTNWVMHVKTIVLLRFNSICLLNIAKTFYSTQRFTSKVSN